MDSSKKAKLFSFIAIGIGAVCIIGYVIFMILGVGLSVISNS
jgi:hypothetical protein